MNAVVRLSVEPESTTSSARLSGLDLQSRPDLKKERVALDKKIESAVYAYIQAIRALGRERIMTSEIANALDLPVAKVVSILDALKEKGVKVTK